MPASPNRRSLTAPLRPSRALDQLFGRVGTQDLAPDLEHRDPTPTEANRGLGPHRAPGSVRLDERRRSASGGPPPLGRSRGPARWRRAALGVRPETGAGVRSDVVLPRGRAPDARRRPSIRRGPSSTRSRIGAKRSACGRSSRARLSTSARSRTRASTCAGCGSRSTAMSGSCRPAFASSDLEDEPITSTPSGRVG